MGLPVNIYKSELFNDCTNGGVSGRDGVVGLCLVNVPGPFEPSDRYPAALLVGGPGGTVNIVPAEADWGDYETDPAEFHPVRIDGSVGPMNGGNYAGSSDSRFDEAVQKILGHRFYGAVAIHDRFETAAQYASYD